MEGTDSKVDNMMKLMDPQQKGTLSTSTQWCHYYIITGYITCNEFVKFLRTIPEDQLSQVLSFKIIKDEEHQSEHSSLDSQPI